VSASLQVIDGGMGNVLQDIGRFGRRAQGMPISGFLDPVYAHCANALVGNSSGVVCLEMRVLGPTMCVTAGTMLVAVVGDMDGKVVRANGQQQPLHSWESLWLFEGDTIKLGVIAGGCAYLAVQGGFEVPSVMDSQSTYARLGLGGFQGRALMAADVLTTPQPLSDQRPGPLKARGPFVHSTDVVRIMLGPQDDYFPATAISQLTQTVWTTAPEQDRMGVRFLGPALQHLTPQHADIVSDGATPGVIQVPASGQPIVLLADCQTVGGYPKIGTVIAADLPKMAHMPAGTSCQFAVVDAAQARRALHDLDTCVTEWLAGLMTYAPVGFLDERALYSENLVSGVLRGD